MKQNPAIETFIDLLKQGKSVIHVAEGYSMFPTLKPGDKILIRPLIDGEIPELGRVVVIYNGCKAQGAGRREEEEGRGVQGAGHKEEQEHGRKAQGAGHKEEQEHGRRTQGAGRKEEQEEGRKEKMEERPGLVLHRLVEIRRDDYGNNIFITRGDAMRNIDPPYQISEIVGTAISFIRNGRSKKTGKGKHSEIFYLRNKVLLSVSFFLRNLKDN
jgi:signal peptidase I